MLCTSRASLPWRQSGVSVGPGAKHVDRAKFAFSAAEDILESDRLRDVAFQRHRPRTGLTDG